MKKTVAGVSVIIPAYQEADTVGRVVSEALRMVSHLDSEVIVIDDGSTDSTAEVAERAGAVVVSHPYNRGYGASLKTGIRSARHPTVVILDADGQHDPAHIPELLEKRQEFEMVVGARQGAAGSPIWRKPGKILLGWLANRLAGRVIPDLNCGFRVLDRDMVLRFIPIMPDGFSFSTTISIAAHRAGYQVAYVPIRVAQRSGTSTVTAYDGLRTFMLIIRLITLFAPLRVFLPVSLVTFLIGLGFTINGYVFHGEASVKGLIALLASVQFFLFGVMVDQVAAIRRGEVVPR